MVESDQDQKTEEPTSKRLDEARGEGKLPISRELATWFSFVGMLVVLIWLGPGMGREIAGGLRVFLERPHQISVEGGGMQDVAMGVFQSMGLPAILAFAVLFATTVVGTMVQTGFYFNSRNIKLDPSKLLPIHGFKRLFSMNSVVELIKSFLKLVVLGYVTYRVLRPDLDRLKVLVDTPMLLGLEFLHDETIHLIVVLMVVITVIAVADWLWVRYSYFKGLRMTKQEVKDEHKQMEGDPIVKSRLRQIRLEKARRRMMANVPGADVVITNPTHFAVALKYDNARMAAPVVIAKGADKIAARIREVAEENEVPLVSNPPLARALYDTVEIDEPIQPDQYRAVAEVISYVYKVKKKKIERHE